jgi:hypothetical protein
MPDVSTEVALATTTLTSTNTIITLSSIPATYTDLRIVCMLKVTNPGTVVGELFRINNDSTSTYSQTVLYGDGTNAVSSRKTTQTSVDLYAGAASSTFLLTTIDIFNYAGSTNKTFLMSGAYDANTGNTTSTVYNSVNLWRSTSAINRIDIVGAGDTFAIGSSVTLYGIL